jgi:hemoglobin-like flavoprotein
MTGAEKQLVERALLEILPILDAVSAGFYTRLLALDPSLRVFLPPDFARREDLFREALGVLLALLDSPRTVRPLLQELGARLRAAGVPRAAYAMVDEALLEMLTLALTPLVSLAIREAWESCYAEMVAALEARARPPGARVPGTTEVQAERAAAPPAMRARSERPGAG